VYWHVNLPRFTLCVSKWTKKVKLDLKYYRLSSLVKSNPGRLLPGNSFGKVSRCGILTGDLRRSAELSLSEAEAKLLIEDECPEEIGEIRDVLDDIETIVSEAAIDIKHGAVSAMKSVLG
jgi:hypothetical protein